MNEILLKNRYVRSSVLSVLSESTNQNVEEIYWYLNELDKSQQAHADEQSQIASNHTQQRRRRKGGYFLDVGGGQVVVKHREQHGRFCDVGRVLRQQLGHHVRFRSQVALVVFRRIARVRQRDGKIRRVALQRTYAFSSIYGIFNFNLRILNVPCSLTYTARKCYLTTESSWFDSERRSWAMRWRHI